MSFSPYHAMTPSLFCNSSGIIDVLEAAEEVLNHSSETGIVEPTPLGPEGVRSLVREVSITETIVLAQDSVDREALSVVLTPLLHEQDSEFVTPAATIGAYIPTVPIDEEDSGDGRHHRPSWWCSSSNKRNLKQTPRIILGSPSNKRQCLSAMPVEPTEAEEEHQVTDMFDLAVQERRGLGRQDDEEHGGMQPEEHQDELSSSGQRFRGYQFDQWKERLQELVDFRSKNGHCLVPHNFHENQQLAQWIKRQRYQHKLKQTNRHSTLSDERQAVLDGMCFVWDSHKAIWMERFESLKRFNAVHGHCNVPSRYSDRSLATWVKCQRRQYKLHKIGSQSTLTQERFSSLGFLGFDWNPRNL
jgi:uncharacterized protein YjhX (UPF0386 family)